MVFTPYRVVHAVILAGKGHNKSTGWNVKKSPRIAHRVGADKGDQGMANVHTYSRVRQKELIFAECAKARGAVFRQQQADQGTQGCGGSGIWRAFPLSAGCRRAAGGLSAGCREQRGR